MSHFSSPSVYPTVTFSTLPAAAASNAGMIFNVSDVGVNGSLWRSNGTKWSPLNGSCNLVQTAMPFIALSSGSVSAAGAISAITALPRAYARAWCWFPANIVATVAAAGWRYCTFSTTTAGTVFLDQPAASFPVTWPSSPTSVTDGKGSYTGNASILLTPTITILANTMGINGRLHANGTIVQTNNGNNKTVGISWGGNGLGFSQGTGTAAAYMVASVENAGVTGTQSASGGFIGTGSASGYSSNVFSVDTTANVTLAMQLQQTTATDNTGFENFLVTLHNDGQ